MTKRNAESLRDALFDELESLRADKTDATRAKAVASLAIAMLKSVDVEMAFREQNVRLAGKDLRAIGDMQLGSEDGDISPRPVVGTPSAHRLAAPRFVKGSAT